MVVHGIVELMDWLLVDGLCGLRARQDWVAMMMSNLMLYARHGLVGSGLVHGQCLWARQIGLIGSYYVYATSGQAVWAVWLDGGWHLHGPSLPKHGLT